mmetsp:Transcript_2982/g.3418  ORF Transcript_2982/g.3418 Transcript_2982/m.3418 type:complete len:252 (-) Transcript_2982:59-814(-)
MSPLSLHIILFALFIQALPSWASEIFDRGTCLACVEEGCTYCKGSNFFKSSGVCVCSDLSETFFGDCNSVSFGGGALEGKWDCRFSNSKGNVLIVVLSMVFILLIICIWKYRQNHQNAKKNTSSSPGNSNPSTGIFSTNIAADPTIVVNAFPVDPGGKTGGSSSLFSTLNQLTLGGSRPTQSKSNTFGGTRAIDDDDDDDRGTGFDIGGGSAFSAGSTGPGLAGGSSGFDTGGTCTSSGIGGNSGFGGSDF